jgi:hypothetical protein
MTLWLVLVAVWLVGIPASVLVCAVLGVSYDERRLARSAERRAVAPVAKRRVALPLDCGRRAHRAAGGFHGSGRRSSSRRFTG